MKQITSTKFHAMVKENPSVFEHWNTPLEITEFVRLENSPITHLSPFLTFSGKNETGPGIAMFINCPNLKVATGNFEGAVLFELSGIERIENLKTKTNNNNWSATFWGCKNLKIATGTYPGFVNFIHSGIEHIHNLQIENPNSQGQYADFTNCPNLKTLEGLDLSKKIEIEPEKLAAEIKRRNNIKRFAKKTQAQELPFL
jgi:hypothetical protein